MTIHFPSLTQNQPPPPLFFLFFSFFKQEEVIVTAHARLTKVGQRNLKVWQTDIHGDGTGVSTTEFSRDSVSIISSLWSHWACLAILQPLWITHVSGWLNVFVSLLVLCKTFFFFLSDVDRRRSNKSCFHWATFGLFFFLGFGVTSTFFYFLLIASTANLGLVVLLCERESRCLAAFSSG